MHPQTVLTSTKGNGKTVWHPYQADRWGKSDAASFVNGIQTRLHGVLRNPIHMAPERQLAKKTTIQVYLV